MNTRTMLFTLGLGALAALSSVACYGTTTDPDAGLPTPDDVAEGESDDSDDEAGSDEAPAPEPEGDTGDPGAAGEPEPSDESDTGDDEPPAEIEAQLCERIDACGFLPAGLDVRDCGDVLNRCGDDLLASAYEDWHRVATECVSLSNCVNFADCYAAIDVCQVPDPADPFGPEDSFDACVDGVDNDEDGWIDCDDFDCATSGACMSPPTGAEDTIPACFDGIDNDGDGWVDCDDWDCADTGWC